MPAKDIYHDTVIKALIKSGWKITYNPLALKIGQRDLYIDLGAEKTNVGIIGVEIKSFVSPSPIADLHNALGQYLLYKTHLKRIAPQIKLYLAIKEETMNGIFSEPVGYALIEEKIVKLLVFDEINEVVKQWIH